MSVQWFMQIHETSTLRLTDRDISSSAYETQAGNQTPLGGCQVLAPSPLPRGTVPGAENYLAYPIRPWTTVVKYASFRFKTGTQDPDPFAHTVSPYLEHPHLVIQSPS